MDEERQDLFWDCPLGIENRERVRHLSERSVQHDIVIDKIRDRLPNWSVIVISVLVSMLSVCCTLLVTQNNR